VVKLLQSRWWNGNCFHHLQLVERQLQVVEWQLFPPPAVDGTATVGGGTATVGGGTATVSTTCSWWNGNCRWWNAVPARSG